ncbi:hypothetical protein LIER_00923 [Lithospermum erythrorhizon]|uniref:Xyloglucan endo-transglycosylase C-terminal domain-containing protein n=1 Tax=Lithospermum erythrorhizon TaxID=34254 RepID=A0AAV3NJ56_LITER
MRVLCSLWNADDWATQGGREKTYWTQAPFTAYYGYVKCSSSMEDSRASNARNRKGFLLIYNYCAYNNRFPQGISVECSKT